VLTRDSERLFEPFGSEIGQLAAGPGFNFSQTLVDGLASVQVEVVAVQVEWISLE